MTEPTPDTEVVTLAGLRRLVLHARNALKRTSRSPSYGWGVDEVNAFAAHQMALHVLTLVADCLPGESLTQDQADQLRAELKASREATAAVRAEAAERFDAMSEAQAEAAETLDAYTELEGAALRVVGVGDETDLELPELLLLMEAKVEKAEEVPAETTEEPTS